MGGAKRQLEEYEEFLVANNMPLDADTKVNIVTMALEATRLELEFADAATQARQRSLFAGAEIARSRERIFRLLATEL